MNTDDYEVVWDGRQELLPPRASRAHPLVAGGLTLDRPPKARVRRLSLAISPRRLRLAISPRLTASAVRLERDRMGLTSEPDETLRDLYARRNAATPKKPKRQPSPAPIESFARSAPHICLGDDCALCRVVARVRANRNLGAGVNGAVACRLLEF